MKRKWMLVALGVVVLLGLYVWNSSTVDLTPLEGDELQEAIASKRDLTVEDIHQLQQRGEWEAVELAIQSEKVKPTPELFLEALQYGTSEVIRTYLAHEADPFAEVNGEPLMARVYGENADAAKWNVVHEEVHDDRLLVLAADALDLNAVTSLLDAGAVIPVQAKESILYQAVRHNHVVLIERLIANGALWTSAHEQLAREFRSDAVLNWMKQR
ncbi:hypothetical protein [Exiguobacterium alkaliphilum]|uniref:hypothetical protein n=1 Tax=Exiguobacterium alkaliphilum TaxID=1428684 RepID=UPI00055197C0|nr:hypothetical protein [Exiguobacterium alkaliphilum]